LREGRQLLVRGQLAYGVKHIGRQLLRFDEAIAGEIGAALKPLDDRIGEHAMAECRPLLRQRLGVGRGIDGDARIGASFSRLALKALPE